MPTKDVSTRRRRRSLSQALIASRAPFAAVLWIVVGLINGSPWYFLVFGAILFGLAFYAWDAWRRRRRRRRRAFSGP
jgi:Flp pilus assembly protein TadB